MTLETHIAVLLNNLSENVLYSAIPNLTREISGADAVILAVPSKSFSTEKPTWKLAGAAGVLREPIQETPLAQYLDSFAIPVQSTRWLADVLDAESGATLREREAALESGYRSCAFIPLQGKTQLAGVLILFFIHTHEYDKSLKLELGKWGGFCALALEQPKKPQVMPVIPPSPAPLPAAEKTEPPGEETEGEMNLSQMGMIASSISHEVTNSLDGIKNYLYLINSEMPEDHPHKEYMKIIEGEIIRAGQIIRQLSDLNKPGKYAKSDLNLNELIESVLPLLDYLVKGKNYEFKLQLDPAIPHIMGVPEQLKSVLINLMKNAIQAMAKGGIITVKTSLSEEHPGKVQIIVADNGPGIPRKDLDKVFQPFFTTKEKGTGLGLTICRQIIKAHGGYITVDSAPRKGTEFTITLPTGEEQEA
jgi:two-component sensor histidine kinase